MVRSECDALDTTVEVLFHSVFSFLAALGPREGCGLGLVKVSG